MPAPPNSQPDPRHMARLYVSLIPEPVLKSIGSGELSGRLAEAARLGAQANDPVLSPELRAAAKLRAQAVLTAQPRQVTEARHAELVRKAAQTRDPRQAEAIRRKADRLIEEQHPVAPRRAVVHKAAAADDEPIPVFDQAGNLIGICKPSALTPLAGTTAGTRQASPSGDAGQDQVVKAARAAGKTVVYDSSWRPHVARPGSVQWPGARVAKGTTAEENARFQRKRDGKMLPGDDEGDDNGYGTGVADPHEQARRGSVRAGGTTGLGSKRKDKQQRALPGDVPDRTVIKAGWAPVHDWQGVLVSTVRKSVIVALPAGGRVQVAKSATGRTHANVYNASRKLVGMARLTDIVPLTAAERANRGRRR